MKVKLAVLLACLLLAWSAAALRFTKTNSNENVCPVTLTQAMYDAISTGMTIDEVTQFVGCKASSEFASSSQNREVKKLVWSGNGQFLSADFHNGRLMAKDKHNLVD